MPPQALESLCHRGAVTTTLTSKGVDAAESLATACSTYSPGTLIVADVAAWEPPTLYDNRYDWRDSPEYAEVVKAPWDLLTAEPRAPAPQAIEALHVEGRRNERRHERQDQRVVAELRDAFDWGKDLGDRALSDDAGGLGA